MINIMASNPYPLSTHPNDGLSQYSSRDLVGYASNPPRVVWPKNAKVALNLVLNYEEGGENCLLHGDGESEKLLSEIVGAGAIGKYQTDEWIYVH
jgi:allantoinase